MKGESKLFILLQAQVEFTQQDGELRAALLGVGRPSTSPKQLRPMYVPLCMLYALGNQAKLAWRTTSLRISLFLG